MLICGQVSPYEGDMSYLAEAKGVNPFVVPELGREISIVDDLRCFIALRKIIRRFRPDIIHTHTAKAGTLGRLAAFSVNIRGGSKKIRTVHTFHGHVFHSYFSAPKTFVFVQIEKFLARFTDRIIAISPLQKHDICKKYRVARDEKVRVIRLGFDLSAFTGCAENKDVVREGSLFNDSQKKFSVGAVGRLTHVKNHTLLLKAVKLLKDRQKLRLFKFFIIGDGELRTQLEDEARNLRVSEDIVFTGWQRDMASIYRALDAVVLTSRNEGTPVTLIEAMAAARPVVATEVGGVRDVLGAIEGKNLDVGFHLGANGVLVPPENAEALADALLFIMEKRETTEQMVRNAKEFVTEKYSLSRLIDDMENLYREILDKGAA
jgi:glycosyltransferase involved in cell wall biosynthesis